MALPVQFDKKDRYTEDEYFAFDETSEGLWEYVDGEIRAMSGGTDDHTWFAGNINAAIRKRLSTQASRVYGAEMRIHTGDGVNTFPDVAVVCGPREYY